MKHTAASILAIADLVLALLLAIGAAIALAWADPGKVSSWMVLHQRGFRGLWFGGVHVAVLVLGAIPTVVLVLAVLDFLRGRRRPAALAAVLALGLALVPLLWLLLGSHLASFQERRAERAWTAALESTASFEARFPAAPASPRALELGASASELGVEILPNAPGRGERPPLDVRNGLYAYISAQTRKESDVIDPPGSDISEWLSLHE